MEKTLYYLDKKDLIEVVRNALKSSYDPVFGFSKEQMMEELNISSPTTFYDRVKKGKIISKEVGGSQRYFLP